MKTITLEGVNYTVDKYYKEGVKGFYDGENGNPYKKGSKRYFQYGCGWRHASANIITEVFHQYLSTDRGMSMDKKILLKELEGYANRLPPGISGWDASKTAQYKAALKTALSKKKSSADALFHAVNALRIFYK